MSRAGAVWRAVAFWLVAALSGYVWLLPLATLAGWTALDSIRIDFPGTRVELLAPWTSLEPRWMLYLVFEGYWMNISPALAPAAAFALAARFLRCAVVTSKHLALDVLIGLAMQALAIALTFSLWAIAAEVLSSRSILDPWGQIAIQPWREIAILPWRAIGLVLAKAADGDERALLGIAYAALFAGAQVWTLRRLAPRVATDHGGEPSRPRDGSERRRQVLRVR